MMLNCSAPWRPDMDDSSREAPEAYLNRALTAAKERL
jgi:hypothetical protein